ncbi:MAG: extracellular solute-binding protein [Alphaproteobacteria bacterium]|nr:extracellular solute-binding protein [Alphaproteobacteria bacterium]
MLDRRTLLASTAGLAAAGLATPTPARAQAPAPSKITPELIEAARKEGKLAFYTSVEIQVGERIAKAFEAKFPGIKVQVERSGSERIYQRIGQERSARILNCDVISTSDAAHFIIWKRDGWLEPHLPEDVALHFPADQREPDSAYAMWRYSLSVMGYNTKLVPAAEAPKSLTDLLDPKWNGKMVKAHPSYSGTILTATFQIARDLGWPYLEKLSKQKVMQVQSATEPPKKLSLGERAIMVDGNDYVLMQLRDQGNPVEVIYATDGSPLIISPSAVMKNAPNPNAAKLFQNYLFTAEGQQYLVDVGFMRSFHPQVKARAGVPPLSEIKVMKEDAAAVVDRVEQIKERYRRLFGT